METATHLFYEKAHFYITLVFYKRKSSKCLLSLHAVVLSLFQKSILLTDHPGHFHVEKSIDEHFYITDIGLQYIVEMLEHIRTIVKQLR